MTVPSTAAGHYLEINSVPLHTHAWRTLTLAPLLAMPAIRGDNRLIPGADGMKPYRKRVTETRYSFPFLIEGQVDQDGLAHSDPFEGLLANIEYLRTNVAVLNATGDGTYDAVYHRPGTLDSYETTCHVTAFEPTDEWSHRHHKFTLEISVPSGAWSVVT